MDELQDQQIVIPAIDENAEEKTYTIYSSVGGKDFAITTKGTVREHLRTGMEENEIDNFDQLDLVDSNTEHELAVPTALLPASGSILFLIPKESKAGCVDDVTSGNPRIDNIPVLGGPAVEPQSTLEVAEEYANQVEAMREEPVDKTILTANFVKLTEDDQATIKMLYGLQPEAIIDPEIIDMKNDSELKDALAGKNDEISLHIARLITQTLNPMCETQTKYKVLEEKLRSAEDLSHLTPEQKSKLIEKRTMKDKMTNYLSKLIKP